MLLAVAYLRVSTEEQKKHGFSIETQQKACEEFAKNNGYRIKKIYVEPGRSAKNLNRPQALEMLKYCNCTKNGVKAIIVWRLDRLSRFCVDYHGTIRPILMDNQFSEYEKRTTDEIRKQIDILTKRIKNSYIDKLEGRLPACMSDEDFNSMHREWQEEKDRLLIKLQENNADSKSVYKRMDFILKFSEKLPELFKKGTSEEKKIIISTMVKSIIFDGENVQIELKETFKALQNVNKIVKIGDRNLNLRTPENPIISTKNDVLETSFDKWAGCEGRTHAYRNHNPRP